VKVPYATAWAALRDALTPASTRFAGRSRRRGTAGGPPRRVRPPYHSWGASFMLDVLFVGVTVAVFVVIALIVKGVEKL
jgi:hypothetical protein